MLSLVLISQIDNMFPISTCRPCYNLNRPFQNLIFDMEHPLYLRTRFGGQISSTVISKMSFMSLVLAFKVREAGVL